MGAQKDAIKTEIVGRWNGMQNLDAELDPVRRLPPALSRTLNDEILRRG
jgi:hypothetical protein